MSMINPLAKARGHGSAKSGTHHWFQQRASALILIPLCSWLLYAMVHLSEASYADAAAFIAAPFNAGAFILLIIAVLYHGMLGLQIVIEDYVQHAAVELALQLLVKGLAYAGMVMGVIYILQSALGA